MILVSALILNVNLSSEQYITLIQGCISIKLQHHIMKLVLIRTAKSLVSNKIKIHIYIYIYIYIEREREREREK